ncbi:response regulator [Myxococcota bacterium]|nr:response regulator [Myxococcota bacterium]MBU1380752.1 response regulator [Myxococcota bacterium]MBU1498020.1 response regulator [Myxococcota bacterium]
MTGEVAEIGWTPNVMIVDDQLESLELLGELLKRRGYVITQLSSGVEALARLLEFIPDLFILDINMPDMNGFDVAESIRDRMGIKDIPILFLSGEKDLGSKVKAFKHGAVDYITKPFQVTELIARVDIHLRIRKLQKDLAERNQFLEQMVMAQVKEISESQIATIAALAKLAESRDDDTGKHIERVQTLCHMIGEKLASYENFRHQINEDFLANLYHASPLHDIGKVGIPDAILLKPGKLTPEEFETMKTHAALGARTLEEVHSKYPKNTFIKMGIEIAKCHHEKWDGSGYPQGLTMEQIPLSARIMAVVDVYDALRSRRPYKEPMTHEKAIGIIYEGSGKHFDPRIINVVKSIENDIRITRDLMAE